MYDHSDYCCQSGALVAYSHFTDASWAYIYKKNNEQFIYSIQKLIFSYGNSSVEFIPNWDWISELYLSECSVISHLPSLINVRDVTIVNCPFVDTLPLWPRIHKLVLIGCNKISVFPNWLTVTIVHIIENNTTTSLPCWPASREIVISGFTKLQNFPNWPLLNKFTCNNCLLINALPKWRNLSSIMIHNCQNVIIPIYINPIHINFSFLQWTVPRLLPTEQQYRHMCKIKKSLVISLIIKKWRLFCKKMA